MSDLLTDLDLAPEHETLKEPPKLWRNWWISTTPQGRFCGRCDADMPVQPVGAVFTNCCPCRFPSRDVAESYAADDLAQHGFIPDQYLGAYPEGERP